MYVLRYEIVCVCVCVCVRACVRMRACVCVDMYGVVERVRAYVSGALGVLLAYGRGLWVCAVAVCCWRTGGCSGCVR